MILIFSVGVSLENPEKKEQELQDFGMFARFIEEEEEAEECFCFYFGVYPSFDEICYMCLGEERKLQEREIKRERLCVCVVGILSWKKTFDDLKTGVVLEGCVVELWLAL